MSNPARLSEIGRPSIFTGMKVKTTFYVNNEPKTAYSGTWPETVGQTNERMTRTNMAKQYYSPRQSAYADQLIGSEYGTDHLTDSMNPLFSGDSLIFMPSKTKFTK